MLEKILKSKETQKLTKKEQKNILGGEYASDLNCNETAVEKFNAC